MIRGNEMPPLVEIKKYSAAGNKEALFKFWEEFVRPVVGVYVWNRACSTTTVTEMLDPSSEAFALLALENNWLVWNELASLKEGEKIFMEALINCR